MGQPGVQTNDPRDSQRFEAVIQIDRSQFRVGQRHMRGHELRELPNPSVGPDRDLFLVDRGSSADELIGEQSVVGVEDGMSFFTVPRTINPGCLARTLTRIAKRQQPPNKT